MLRNENSQKQFKDLKPRLTLLVLCFWLVIFFHCQAFADGIDFCFDASNEGHRSDAEVIKYVQVQTWMDCIVTCILHENISCMSVNFQKTSGWEKENCELLAEVDRAGNLIKNESFNHYILLKTDTKVEKPNSSQHNSAVSINNGSLLNPGKSCQNILAANGSAESGIYWIKLASGEAFQVYCDMKTQGGGWTLVYSYTFTNYDSFSSVNNGVTPRPNWPAGSANLPISTTPPLNESLHGAVDWNLWKNIGEEFLIKSNINDWLVCKPHSGSIVIQSEGSVTCQNIKNVALDCNGVAPNIMKWFLPGPALILSGGFYSFDGYTHGNYPTHDSCGTGTPSKHKKGVNNPGGQIYLR